MLSQVLTLLYMLTSPTFGWTGRSLSLLDPTYAAKYIPIIASVSEHQPPAWNAYFMDIHAMVLLMPVGFIFCFRPLTDASLFLVLYGLTAVYFSGVMVRLMLVLAPAACCLAAFAVSELLDACWAGIFSREIALAAAAAPVSPLTPGTPCALPCLAVLLFIWWGGSPLSRSGDSRVGDSRVGDSRFK